jgi:hypothetical protein
VSWVGSTVAAKSVERYADKAGMASLVNPAPVRRDSRPRRALTVLADRAPSGEWPGGFAAWLGVNSVAVVWCRWTAQVLPRLDQIDTVVGRPGSAHRAILIRDLCAPDGDRLDPAGT